MTDRPQPLKIAYRIFSDGDIELGAVATEDG